MILRNAERDLKYKLQQHLNASRVSLICTAKQVQQQRGLEQRFFSLHAASLPSSKYDDNGRLDASLGQAAVPGLCIRQSSASATAVERPDSSFQPGGRIRVDENGSPEGLGRPDHGGTVHSGEAATTAVAFVWIVGAGG